MTIICEKCPKFKLGGINSPSKPQHFLELGPKSGLSLALKIKETTMLPFWDFYVLQLLRGGGVPEPWNVTDVFGLDPDLLVMVPQPVKALILLFPMTEAVSWSVKASLYPVYISFGQNSSLAI